MKKTTAHSDMPAANEIFKLNQLQEQDRALISAPKEYSFEDFWGDSPILTSVKGDENAPTEPETKVVSEPKRSWLERLMQRLGGSAYRSVRVL